MSTELVTTETAVVSAAAARPADSLTDIQRLGKLLAASGYFQDAQEMAQAAVKVMAGRELGVSAIAAMTGIHVIKGKITMGSNLLAARIRAHGYDFSVTDHDTHGCTITILSKDKDTVGQRSVIGVERFAEAEAHAAGLTSNPMYKKFPKNMYFSRAVSNAIRFFIPEITSGVPVYTPDELGAEVDAEGNVVHQPAAKSETSYTTGETREEIAARRITEIRAEPETVGPPETPSTGDEVPVGVRNMWDMMRDYGSSCEVFKQLKTSISETQGSEADYYRILEEHGMKHGNDLKAKPRAQIRRCARALLQHLDKCKAALAEPPLETPPAPFEATDDDLPDALQGAVSRP
jgi:hypothetical protein